MAERSPFAGHSVYAALAAMAMAAAINGGPSAEEMREVRFPRSRLFADEKPKPKKRRKFKGSPSAKKAARAARKARP